MKQAEDALQYEVIRCIECGKDTRARGDEPRCKPCRKQNDALSTWARTLEKKVRKEVAAKGPLKIENKVAGKIDIGSVDVNVRDADENTLVKCPFCYGKGYRGEVKESATFADRCAECNGFGSVMINKKMIPEMRWYQLKGRNGWQLGTSAVEPEGTIGGGEVRFDLSRRRKP